MSDQKWRVIGIRVDANSSLHERLNILGIKLRMTHSELLERFIVTEEKRLESMEQAQGKIIFDPINNPEIAPIPIIPEPAPAPAPTPEAEPKPTPTPTPNMTDVIEEIMASALDKINARLASLEARPEPKPQKPNRKTMLLKRIAQMAAEGISQRRIAETLNAEGVPTLSGKGTWSGGTISKLPLKRQE